MLLLKQDERRPGDPGLRALKALMQAISAETLADLAAYYSSLR
jgi:cytochrome c553